MGFGEQIVKVRTANGLTQEQFAARLNVTRQAVSNWENDRNLPDIAMLIQIAPMFPASLDQLILGGTNMNNMTEKLIKDGSDTHRAKLNLAATVVGAVLMLTGLLCFVIKELSGDYVDATGLLHEKFFLIPIGLLFLFCGALVIVVTGICFLVRRGREKKQDAEPHD